MPSNNVRQIAIHVDLHERRLGKSVQISPAVVNLMFSESPQLDSRVN